MRLDYYFENPHPTRATSCTRIWTGSDRYCNVQHLNVSTSHGVILRVIELNYSNIQTKSNVKKKRAWSWTMSSQDTIRNRSQKRWSNASACLNLHATAFIALCTCGLYFLPLQKNLLRPFFQFLPILARNLRHRLNVSKSEIKGRKFVLSEINISNYILTYLLHGAESFLRR